MEALIIIGAFVFVLAMLFARNWRRECQALNETSKDEPITSLTHRDWRDLR